ncbi:MAG TPA: hypothetical protein VGB55_12985 [Tepidisphaeraceae bacterium]|jgi:hypothetical protein
MRYSSSSSRPSANRRAYRPDRQIYRNLRRRNPRRRRRIWLTVFAVAATVLVLAAVVKWLV